MDGVDDLLPSWTGLRFRLCLFSSFSLNKLVELIRCKLPEFVLLVFALNETLNIERIDEGHEHVAFSLPAWAVKFGLAICCEEDFVRSWKVPSGMEPVEHGGVEEHDGSLEDIEIKFVSKHLSAYALEVFDNAVNAASSDDDGTDIHENQDGLEILFHHTSLVGSEMEDSSYDNEGDEHGALKQEPGFYKRIANFPLTFRPVCVGHSQGAIDNDGFA